MPADKSLRNKVVGYLKHLGLDDEQAQVYLYLLSHGPSSVLSISRGIGTGRTKLYPLLESLTKKQLVVTHERHYGTSYEAQPPQAVEFLVSEQERAAQGLRSSLPAALNILSSLQTQSPTHSKIIEYKGVDGLKQMNFNLTKAEGEYRTFELAGLDKHLGTHFANKMREKYVDNELTSYDLTNNPDRLQESGADLPDAHIRYIDPGLFAIEFEMTIYNNCVALLNYDHEDIFGVEIYNDKLARQQRQLFDAMWATAKPLK